MSTTTTSKGWNIALWIVQVILAAMFLMAGFTKITKTEADLAAMMPWTEAVPLLMVRFIGTAEFLGGSWVIAALIVAYQARAYSGSRFRIGIGDDARGCVSYIPWRIWRNWFQPYAGIAGRFGSLGPL